MAYWQAIAQIASAIAGKVEGNRAIAGQQRGPIQGSNGSIINLLQQTSKWYNGLNSAKTADEQRTV